MAVTGLLRGDRGRSTWAVNLGALEGGWIRNRAARTQTGLTLFPTMPLPQALFQVSYVPM